MKLKGRNLRYCIIEGKLYKRSLSEPYLLCVSAENAFKFLRQAHDGSCGSHSGGRSLAIIIKKLGYFCPTIAHDSEQFVIRCNKCQLHTLMILQPAQRLSSVSSP
ncbi:hypothetical protein N665_0092s0011 [Sinapis alba]|nr:hypothetical protein N665_0092s0011 [Sinapis alba]